MSSARIQARVMVGIHCSKPLRRSHLSGGFICRLINNLEYREKAIKVDQYLTSFIGDGLTPWLGYPRTRRWQYSIRPHLHFWRVFGRLSRPQYLDGVMVGDGIAEYGHRADSVTYFEIDAKRIVISSVTYGSNPIISKPNMKWNSRKVFAQ